MFARRPNPLAGHRVASVNVDIDGLHLYYRIHGLPEPDSTQSVYDTGVRRFLELFRRAGLRATFFAVGEDLEQPEHADVIRELLADGHELASHSYTHPYRLVHLPAEEMEEELSRAEDAISAFTGSPPKGFRAPGYNTSPELLRMVAQRGYAYDSSIFPSPAYVGAKAAAIGLYSALGRPSESILSDWRAAFAPTHPYRHASGLLELPISVLPVTRFPFIGTSVVTTGEPGFRLMSPQVSRLDFVNLEFHAIDLCGVTEDGLDEALRRQPDQKVPLERRQRTLERWMEFLAGGWDNATLAEVAEVAEVGERER